MLAIADRTISAVIVIRAAITSHRATVAALKDPETQKRLAELGVEISGDSPQEFAAYIKREIPKWAAVVKASGARLE